MALWFIGFLITLGFFSRSEKLAKEKWYDKLLIYASLFGCWPYLWGIALYDVVQKDPAILEQLDSKLIHKQKEDSR